MFNEDSNSHDVMKRVNDSPISKASITVIFVVIKAIIQTISSIISILSCLASLNLSYTFRKQSRATCTQVMYTRQATRGNLSHTHHIKDGYSEPATASSDGPQKHRVRSSNGQNRH